MINFKNHYFSEGDCEKYFNNNKPYWHLLTSGRDQDVIFDTKEEFEFALTSSAISLVEVNGFCKAKVKVLAFAIMENHIHEILVGEQRFCLEYFQCRKRRLRRYFSRAGKSLDLSGFNCQLLPITSLQGLRKEIIYVNSNYFGDFSQLSDFQIPLFNKLNNSNSSKYYFTEREKADELPSINGMSYMDRKNITKSDAFIYPDTYTVKDNNIYPPSFCDITLGESMFCSEKQYRQMFNNEGFADNTFASTIRRILSLRTK